MDGSFYILNARKNKFNYYEHNTKSLLFITRYMSLKV